LTHTKNTRFPANHSAVFDPDHQTTEFRQNDSTCMYPPGGRGQAGFEVLAVFDRDPSTCNK